MGAEDITEVCSFYIVTARRRIGWVGDMFSLGPALCFFAPVYPAQSLGLAVSANCRVQILRIRQ